MFLEWICDGFKFQLYLEILQSKASIKQFQQEYPASGQSRRFTNLIF